MVTLRLFHRSDPARELESRALGDGEIVVGRDAEADWSISDPIKTLSRRHCRLALRGGELSLRDDSTNGVFLQSTGRAPRGEKVVIAAGETLTLGDFLILVDRTAPQPRAATTLGLSGRPLAVGRRVESRPAVAAEPPRSGTLLEAFCSGSQIDASAFSGEDSTQVMRRIGAIYRQMVLGLGELMNERTRSKAEHKLERTTVQAMDNNPFRWAPPHRVAIDLLQSREDGFLTGDAAVQSSFDDLKTHQLAMDAAGRAAAAAILGALAPAVAAERLKGQSFVMKNKAAALWEEYLQVHAELSGRAAAPDGPVGRAFREAYESVLAACAVEPPPEDSPEEPVVTPAALAAEG